VEGLTGGGEERWRSKFRPTADALRPPSPPSPPPVGEIGEATASGRGEGGKRGRGERRGGEVAAGGKGGRRLQLDAR
jgi:hypothetical protein